MTQPISPLCTIVPPYLLDRLAGLGHEGALRSRQLDAALRAARAAQATPPPDGEQRAGEQPAAGPAAAAGVTGRPGRTIADAEHTEHLPGRAMRTEGGPPTADPSVNRAYDGLGATLALLLEVYGRRSVDGAGLPLHATVHYGTGYDNAFWDGRRMVFGDGDGTIFGDFTGCPDVIGHELAHGLVQYSTKLAYHGQPGALNESVADVFGTLAKQYALGQQADDADWLIGAGLFGSGVRGVALRSLKAPGTAYDDPRLGRDPQPGSMDDYVETDEDEGGVHINSGIPNRAFQLLAADLGGAAWERAGRIWYDAVTGPELRPDADFAAFARATVTAARTRFGEGPVPEAVAGAWKRVGLSAT
ncbi:Zn-dependent metalloprotease [Kitasatospora sp. GAS204A]|uniref:M4 family metallopeptidase n=1 Tax=unclassified Kitasatospora TaxID=2633591 RepID=UPI0024746ADA|nr:M4 family metallopeptidase [Kitasatospora sp. GAS204B]MDH6118700.1 Zn-dependent metalloprotease [Kitasatospora sp. GAS204B]